MSAETYEALGRAITDHVLDESIEPADFVRDWALVASTSSMDSDGESAEIVVFRAATTPLYAVTGLLEWGKSAYGEVEL
jgi:hypothetical protein